jgi:hypothetical protein
MAPNETLTKLCWDSATTNLQMAFHETGLLLAGSETPWRY